ncbi:hypothetical protein CAPTEDRAFT_141039 [Capitella teleta]|uniref:FAD dependent oxidoreductase domain-containing protein n=1 Tax=Capitella teleta TaxID=283909 RepID=R7ULZ0_CAPTE|nr:hypothetical protein CAPTEDRAFT_141039 [Capitella teleta]|eukprot:ELU07078.1 hypothetical protein CAPTEDRAFT_141039 [Capitella teleta]
MDIIYDLCIVGAGLIGSSAAKHASLQSGLRVLIIGKEEPRNRKDSPIHGAYYDEARIAAPFTGHPFWLNAFRDSLDRFASIEEASGKKFFHETGFVSAGPQSTQYITQSLSNCATAGIKHSVLTSSEAKERYPFLHINTGDCAVEIKSGAGWLNPRTLREAQLSIASANGCEIVDGIVKSIKEEDCNDANVVLRMELLSGGEVFRARKVLLCTGAFTGCNQLLPKELQPEVSMVTQSVVFAELDDLERKRFVGMPTMVNVESDSTVYQKKSCYVLPPIKYPDGKWYLKLGHGSQFERVLSTPQELYDWYTSPIPEDFKSGLVDILRSNFPDLRPLGCAFDSCVTTNTANRHPMIDMVTSNIAVAIGGNGYAAKCCDQIGKLGSDVILGKDWPSIYCREALRYKANKDKSKL